MDESGERFGKMLMTFVRSSREVHDVDSENKERWQPVPRGTSQTRQNAKTLPNCSSWCLSTRAKQRGCVQPTRIRRHLNALLRAKRSANCWRHSPSSLPNDRHADCK